MSTKTTKKTATKKSTKAAKELVASQPSLQEILAGTSPAVAKAVAEKRAKVEAEKPLAPAPAKKTAAKKGNKKADEKTAKEPRATSGALIKQMILAGDDAETILAAVKKAFPDSNATKGDVSWNKWDLKRKGLLK